MSVDSNFRHLPQFDRDPSKFRIYWVRFQGHATAVGCEDALETTVDPDLPATKKATLSTNAATALLQTAAFRRNHLAISLYSMSFTTSSLIQLITKTITTDWPQGQAHLITKELLDLYQPVDKIALVELANSISSIRMKPSDSPSVFFEPIAAIEVRYREKITDEEKLAIVTAKDR